MRSLRRPSHRESFEYLRSWGTNFVKNTEEQIKDVTVRVEHDLKAGASLGISDVLNLGAEGVRTLSEEKRFDVHRRGQEVLNSIQVNKLASLFKALDEDILDDPKKRYYIILDKLDENWVEDETRYRLIRALIEIMRDFNSKVTNAKIIIALRSDLFERVLRATTDSGFQGEKYRGLCLPLIWDKSSMINLVDLRVNELVQRRWTTQPMSHADILRGTVTKHKEKPLDYMLDRTLMRPRDIIAFFNACMVFAAKESEIYPTTIVRTEPVYSEQRLDSLADEWSADYPLLREICGLLKKRPISFPLSSITDDHLEELCLRLADRLSLPTTEDAQCLDDFFRSRIGGAELRTALARILYRVGAVGLKPESYSQIAWSFNGPPEFPAEQLSYDSKMYPHKMLWRALGIVA